jgi:hypothetical protein
MSAEKNIITQSEIGPIKTEEAELAENLYAHANASLSKAHGMEFVRLTYPFTDTEGNEVSQYYDSNGDIVGYYQMRLTYSNTNYYVPLISSMLSGQTALKGVRSSSGISIETGDSAWVTDFTSGAVNSLAVANTTMLLPHTQLSHWETHTSGIFSVLPMTVLDSAGHIVGNYVARLVFDGKELLVPCDSRLGGPAQVPRLQAFITNHYSFKSSSPNSAMATTPLTINYQGTAPVTFQWQVSINNSLWQDLAPGVNVWFTLSGWQGGIQTIWTSTASPTLIINYMSPAENRWQTVYLRAIVTNSAGSVTTGVIQIDIYDKTGSWIVYAAHAAAPFTDQEMRRLYHLRLWALENRTETTHMYMGSTGDKLVEIMRKKGFDFTTLTAEIQTFLKADVNMKERYRRFESMVVRCLAEHWPDCPDPVAQRLIVNLLHP